MTRYIVRDIERAVCLRFKLVPEQLRGRDCHRKIARPRQIAMALARELTAASLPQIGRHFGRDHTTVLHACRKIRNMVEEGGRMIQYLDEVRAILLGLTPVKQEIAQSIATLYQPAEPPLLTETQTQPPPRVREHAGGGDAVAGRGGESAPALSTPTSQRRQRG